MSEHQDKVIHFIYRTSVFSGQQVIKLLPAMLRALSSDTPPKIVRGEQSIPELNRQNRELTSIPVSDEDIRFIKKELLRFGVDFSVYTDKANNSTHIFFKAQDNEVVQAALKNTIQKIQNREERLDALISAAKAAAKQANKAAEKVSAHTQNIYQKRKSKTP